MSLHEAPHGHTLMRAAGVEESSNRPSETATPQAHADPQFFAAIQTASLLEQHGDACHLALYNLATRPHLSSKRRGEEERGKKTDV